ncbi:MAG: hypothetical protein M3081_20225 [Gemmatimonadota bacterium]|nr:hypothetical protein [Gemmatimonadota bacterium]
MSDNERPDLSAFQELEHSVRALGHEIAVWRRRAQLAESRLRELEGAMAGGGAHPDRLAELERENKDMRGRLDAAGERMRVLLERTQFLRQQHEMGTER